jgi:glycopeptide antibiotics resistance protein
MRNKTVKTVLFILFVIYCAALAFVLFFPNLHRYSHGSRLYNITPFAAVSELIGRLIEGTINADIVVRNIGVNILLFVPMGAFLPVLFKKLRKFRWVILVCFSATVAAELIQFIFILGSFDVDDIILNTAGAAAGYGIVNIPVLKKLLY